MIEKINHFSFTVSNLENSIRFYQAAFGLECMDISERDRSFSSLVTGIENSYLKIAYLHCKNADVELVQYLTPPGIQLDTKTSNVGSAHICFNVTNFEKVLKAVLTAGGKLAGEVCEIPAGPNSGRKVCYLEDPDGNTIEIISTTFS